jgi:hypothetical protein
MLTFERAGLVRVSILIPLPMVTSQSIGDSGQFIARMAITGRPRRDAQPTDRPAGELNGG